MVSAAKTEVGDAVDREYMTVEDFAALPSEAQHAVWSAHAARRIDSVPAVPRVAAGVHRYHRGQVLALLREAEAAR